MDLEECDLWRLGDACLCGKWSDLRCGKFLKLILALPHVDHADTCVGLGYPMKESAMCTGASGMKSHLLDHLVVLSEGSSGKFLLYADCHVQTSFRDCSNKVHPRNLNSEQFTKRPLEIALFSLANYIQLDIMTT